MIKVLIKREENKFVSLEVKGHANSAENGKDLVCAGVSAVINGGLNNLQELKKFDIKSSDGYAYVEAKEAISSHDEVVIETIITGLKTIEESNPDFITIKNF